MRGPARLSARSGAGRSGASRSGAILTGTDTVGDTGWALEDRDDTAASELPAGWTLTDPV